MPTAGQMFDEICCESMQKLIVSVANKDVKPCMTFNLQPLDAYLASLTALRTQKLNPVDIIEIEGHPGSGKTHLFYHFLSNYMIPRHYPSSALDGGVKTAVVFDMDAQFDISRFRDIMAARIRQNFGSTTHSTDIVDGCLENLYIFNPITTEQLLATLVHFPKIWRSRCPHDRLGIIAIHSLEALYWSDRFKVEPRTRAATFPGKNFIYQKVYSCLRSIQEKYETRVILSHSGTNQVLQHNISQQTGNQDPKYLDDNATITGVSDGSTLFLSVMRVLRGPDNASQTSGSCVRLSGQVLAEREPIVFDVKITQSEGVVVVQEGQ